MSESQAGVKPDQDSEKRGKVRAVQHQQHTTLSWCCHPGWHCQWYPVKTFPRCHYSMGQIIMFSATRFDREVQGHVKESAKFMQKKTSKKCVLDLDHIQTIWANRNEQTWQKILYVKNCMTINEELEIHYTDPHAHCPFPNKYLYRQFFVHWLFVWKIVSFMYVNPRQCRGEVGATPPPWVFLE